MAIEIRNDVATRETRVPLLNDPVLTPETLKQLQIPESVALKPEYVIPFLNQEFVRLQSIVNRPEIKALSADLPPPEETTAFLKEDSLISGTESEALQSWALSIQSAGESGGSQLSQDIESHIKDMLSQHPEWSQSQQGQSMDPFDVMFANQMMKETEDQKKQREALIAAAASSGDPATIALVMGITASNEITRKIGRLLEMQKLSADTLDQIRAEFDLKSQGGAPTTADMAVFNSDFSRAAGDRQTIMQLIQSAMSDYDSSLQMTHSLTGQINQAEKSIVANYRS